MISGIGTPKFIGNITTTRDEVILNHCVVLENKFIPSLYEIKSLRSGKKVFTNEGKHKLFKVVIYLWKYTDPEAAYLNFKTYEGTTVELFEHEDGAPYSLADASAVPFKITSMNESYRDDRFLLDTLTITFESIERLADTQPQIGMYDTAYLMDHIDDDPVGSIGTTNDSFLYDVFNIPGDYGTPTVKGLSSNGVAIEETYNGHTVLRYNGGAVAYNSSIYRSASLDLFDGVVNVTLLVAFKKRAIDTARDAFIFNHYTPNNAQNVQLAIRRTHKLYIAMGNLTSLTDPTVVEGMSVETTSSYDDSAWHIAAAVFNQETKTVKLYTDLGEYVTANNPDYTQAYLNTDIVSNPQIGYWRHPNPSGSGVVNMAFFGERTSGTNLTDNYIGDILFFNKAASIHEINYWAEWMAARLNITWERII